MPATTRFGDRFSRFQMRAADAEAQDHELVDAQAKSM
jgi:hypothetical protein